MYIYTYTHIYTLSIYTYVCRDRERKTICVYNQTSYVHTHCMRSLILYIRSVQFSAFSVAGMHNSSNIVVFCWLIHWGDLGWFKQTEDMIDRHGIHVGGSRKHQNPLQPAPTLFFGHGLWPALQCPAMALFRMLFCAFVDEKHMPGNRMTRGHDFLTHLETFISVTGMKSFL